MSNRCIDLSSALSECANTSPPRRKYLFLAANPLQILMSVSIVQQLGISRESLMIIMEGFTDARQISSRFNPEKVGVEGLLLAYSESRNSAISAIKSLQPTALFLDGDVGFKNFRLLRQARNRIKDLQVNVFEEGVGTYRDDLYSGLKRYIFKAFGIGTNFGGSSLTDQVFLIEPHLYRVIFPKGRANLVKLVQGPDQVLSSHFDGWKAIFGYQNVEQFSSSECSLYLSTWDFQPEAVGSFYRSNGDRFIKRHPRCDDEVHFPNASVIGDAAPAEMVVADLANRYSLVRVFHHGSSVERYLSRDNVIYERV